MSYNWLSINVQVWTFMEWSKPELDIYQTQNIWMHHEEKK